MGDSGVKAIQGRRARLRAAERAVGAASMLVAAAVKALARACGTPGEIEAREALEAAKRDMATRNEDLFSARARLESEQANGGKASPDEATRLQPDYTFAEIVEKLNRGHQRATYSAIGALLGASAEHVQLWVLHPRPEYSFVVDARTGEPTRYPRGELHPALRSKPIVLRSRDELLAWLQAHPMSD